MLMPPGENLVIQEGDYFYMVLPDGTVLSVEQTVDDFTMSATDGKILHCQAISESAKADDARVVDFSDEVHQQGLDDAMDVVLCEKNEQNVSAVERLRRAVKKSNAAIAFAIDTLTKTGPAPTWTEDDLKGLSRESLFGIYAMMYMDNMPYGGEDPADYALLYASFEDTPAMTLIHQLAQMRIVK